MVLQSTWCIVTGSFILFLVLPQVLCMTRAKSQEELRYLQLRHHSTYHLGLWALEWSQSMEWDTKAPYTKNVPQKVKGIHTQRGST